VSIAGYSLTTFAPAFLIRSHDMSLGEVGLHYGLASGITGVLGLLVVGRIADHLVAARSFTRELVVTSQA
jgi:hypothetical protein